MKITSKLLPLLTFLSATVCLAATTATPAISLASGAYVMPKSTTITDSTYRSSIKWCHATSGTCTPNTSYPGSISINSAETICASATASGYTQSSTVCHSYTTAQTATPAISLAAGPYVMPQSTTITDSTSRSSIRWCHVTSGTCTPNTFYTGSISVNTNSTETICANATASGYTQSNTACNSYTTAAQTATPAISLASGTYAMPQSTAITDSTTNSSIKWCSVTSGTCTPSATYTGSISVNTTSTETICANATASGFTQSNTTCNSYTTAQAATPAIGLAGGAYVMPQTAAITDTTPGASIQWCSVSSGACTPNLSYTGSISVNPGTTETICANATASGYTQSGTVCSSYTTAQAATPSIGLAGGAYVMPTSTLITDSTTGASIEWCSATSGTCTPNIAYSGSASLNTTSTETICAYATATGYSQSGTVCTSYSAQAPSPISFSYANGQVTMSTPLVGASIFYTLDGSTATEASIEYIPGNPVTVADGVTINAVAVQMTNGTANGVAVQNGQVTASNWKTVLASSSTQSSTYLSSYNSPDIQYGSGNGSCNHGVCGIPTQVGLVVNQQLPSAIGTGTTTNFSMTTENLSGAGGGLQVLWPYNEPSGTTGGCDSCTSMIQDFYIWPQFTGTGPSEVNPANVENWELDMNSWNVAIPTYGYLGASFQCSILDGGWQYNGQYAPGWTNFSSTGFSSMTKINHDCQFPFGTLSADITSTTQQSFTVTPNVTGSVTAATVEPGMIVLLDNEEILCTAATGNTCTASQRGWAGTTPALHSAGALYTGSVHVQYHVTFKPGDTSVCLLNGASGAAVECVFIDYLMVNNVLYNFHTIYGEQTVSGVPGYSALTVPAYTYTYGIDRVYDQKQIDVASGIGSTSSPAQVGEFIDLDNVTASFGVLAAQSYLVP